MASILGLKLKGRCTFKGREWQGNQGYLYLGKVKIAWYNDSGNGGMADIDYAGNDSDREKYERQLEEIVKKYYEMFPLQGEYAKLTPDAEMLISDLLQLMDDEKQYKKNLKLGYDRTAIFKVGKNGLTRYCACKGEAGVEALAKRPDVIIEKVYKGIENFDIKSQEGIAYKPNSSEAEEQATRGEEVNRIIMN